MRVRDAVLLPALAGLAACQPSSPQSTGPSLELVDPTRRLDPRLVNAHTYGTFVITATTAPAVIRSGPANFPGNPPGGPGTCDDGLWINSRGKPTAGSLDHPHPHCISDASSVGVVLEPISSQVHNPGEKCAIGEICDFLVFSHTRAGDLDVEYVPGIKGAPGVTDGDGTVEGYAIDAATLGSTNVRVGIIVIDLNQYDAKETNLFGTCALDDLGTYACLPRVISAYYKPFAVGGIGEAGPVTGFLWWAPASKPYNY